MVKISFERLIDFSLEVLVAKGVPRETARELAELIVLTEAFGIETHGLTFLRYADETIPGEIDPTAEPKLVVDRGAAAVIDGGRCFAQVAIRRASVIALQKASVNGIAMVGIRDVGWAASLGVYLLPIVNKGKLAQLWAQFNTARDCAPFGGIDARFATNPVAIAIPTGGDPIIADFSTAMVSGSKANLMIRRSQKAPERIFMDREGNLTNDPGVVREGGSILFTGGEHFGHKGYGLSLWCEALTAVGGGGCNDPAASPQQNLTLQVIDPECFAGNVRYLTEIQRFVSHVKSSRPRPGQPSVRLPGERGFASLRRAQEEGVPLDEAMIAELGELAAKLGIKHFVPPGF